MKKTEEEWKKTLTEEEYRIIRKKGTEKAFTGKYHNEKKPGEYVCAACGSQLFSSKQKFDSGTGWPSFSKAKNVETKKDFSLLIPRTEVLCKKCGGHLGHVFNDRPKEKGGKRYCINSVALKLKKN